MKDGFCHVLATSIVNGLRNPWAGHLDSRMTSLWLTSVFHGRPGEPLLSADEIRHTDTDEEWEAEIVRLEGVVKARLGTLR